jgi:hypothetical protein
VKAFRGSTDQDLNPAIAVQTDLTHISMTWVESRAVWIVILHTPVDVVTIPITGKAQQGTPMHRSQAMVSSHS